MNVKSLLLCLVPVFAQAQGFAGLGSGADGFAIPQPDPQFSFPADHGAHPDFRIEWWYLTANLKGADGTDYGLQWTLFRSAMAPQTQQGWDDPQLWMGHAAVTTPDDHFVTERLARGGIGQAGVVAEPFAAWIDDWRFDGIDVGALSATGPDFGYDMQLTASGPFVRQGKNGYSVKSASGQASYYYSQPFYDIAGTLHLPQGEIAVTGTAWLDREWSSQPLSGDQTGWDWFSLSFDDGARMMGFRLRQTDGADYTSATWIAPDGTPTPYEDGSLRATPLEVSQVAGRDMPTRWRLELPAQGVDVTVQAINTQAWMTTSVPYWEGPVTIDGTQSGTGYLEMTGYE
ncbi:MAG: putative secreted hydrolase [Loktanella salsilacus]|jgi:predicted secreted hydrolase|uniref:lipocalin-like domain-containing protein n=1 Tax=Loktanella salsilacus TaxID=195913 RepID=UPI003988A65C